MKKQILSDIKNQNDKTIMSVVQDGLCTMCGVCVGVCKPSIQMVLDRSQGLILPRVDFDTCTLCGLCVQVCPGREVDFEQLNRTFLQNGTSDLYLGNYFNIYVGYAADESVRMTGSSGGLVSALLIFALEKGKIDRALVTRMKQDQPLKNEPYIAYNREDILSAAGSKYAPSSVGEDLARVSESPGNFAIVGLPCHVHGFRKAQALKRSLRERGLIIGLFCGYGKSYALTDYILSSSKIKESDVQRLVYRENGWPGFMRIELKDGSIKSIPFSEWYRREFTPSRCIMCSDGLAELADISCGDAWLPEYRGESKGLSIVITRTAQGDALVQEAINVGAVHLKPLARDKVIESQKAMIMRKKRRINAHIALNRRLQRPTPRYQQLLLSPGILDYLRALASLALMASIQRPYLSFINRLYYAIKALSKR